MAKLLDNGVWVGPPTELGVAVELTDRPDPSDPLAALEQFFYGRLIWQGLHDVRCEIPRRDEYRLERGSQRLIRKCAINPKEGVHYRAVQLARSMQLYDERANCWYDL